MAEQVGKFLTELPELTSPSDSNLMYVVDGETSKKATLGNLKKIVGGDVTGAGSGAVVSFSDGADNIPLKSFIAQINPIQDLHGYDNPWPSGADKNQYPIWVGNDNFLSNNGGSYRNDNGELVVSTNVSGANNTGVYAPANSQIGTTIRAMTKPVTISFEAKSDDSVRLRYGESNVSYYADLTSNWTRLSFTVTSDVTAILYIYNSVANTSFRIRNYMIESGSSATSYKPYANVCPITGASSVSANVSDTEEDAGTSVVVQLGREVYGGTLDIATGELLITDGVITVNGSNSVTSIADLGNNVRFWTVLGSGFKTAPEQDESISDYIPCSPRAESYSVDRAEYRPFTADYPTSGWIKLPKNLVGTTSATISAYLTNNPLTIVAPLATPQTIQLTPTEVKSLLGQNYISANTGNSEVIYVRDLNIVINDLINRVTALENE